MWLANFEKKQIHIVDKYYLQVGGLVLVPQLGIPEDEQALRQIAQALPQCEVIGIEALEAVRKGGALNCISWNVRK